MVTHGGSSTMVCAVVVVGSCIYALPLAQSWKVGGSFVGSLASTYFTEPLGVTRSAPSLHRRRRSRTSVPPVLSSAEVDILGVKVEGGEGEFVSTSGAGEGGTHLSEDPERLQNEGFMEGSTEVGPGGVNLFARTWESLDFGVVLKRLAKECRTEMGSKKALVPDFKETLEDVDELYNRVNEVMRMSSPDVVPLRAAMGVEEELDIASTGAVLEPAEIAQVGAALEGLDELRQWFCAEEEQPKGAGGLQERQMEVPRLKAVASCIALDDGLLGMLRGAFDSSGELSGRLVGWSWEPYVSSVG
ncbi:unnamed protein product [Discosporangium mesarthrocarpum]